MNFAYTYYDRKYHLYSVDMLEAFTRLKHVANMPM